MGQINVAIIGVGNCASSLVQGIHKYANAGPDDSIPGIMHPVLGEYMSEVIEKAPGPTDDISGVLRDREVDVVVNYLLAGTEDPIRCAKIAKDRGLAGPIVGPSAYFMKSPPVQYTDSEARQMVEDFVVGRGE